jgi:formamidopyrimidine-DNA glycosylase
VASALTRDALIVVMPELPEVETIRRQLEPVLRGRQFVDAWTFGTPKFAAALDVIGARVEQVGRRGKYLLCDLDDDRLLAIHLGMTGVLRVRRHDREDPYLRAAWTLDDGVVVEFQDVRRFGRIGVVPRDDLRALPTLHALGPEPLSDEFEACAFHEALIASGRAIKTQLLSQRPVAGVGNIYADEALWRARVHPAARTISRPKAHALHAAIRAVLSEALERRGTTLRDYRTFDGDYGENQDMLQVYGRAGEPCARCGRPLRSFPLDARTTTYCAVCQRRR